MTAKSFRITNPGGLYEVNVAALGRIDLTSLRNRRLGGWNEASRLRPTMWQRNSPPQAH